MDFAGQAKDLFGEDEDEEEELYRNGDDDEEQEQHPQKVGHQSSSSEASSSSSAASSGSSSGGSSSAGSSSRSSSSNRSRSSSASGSGGGEEEDDGNNDGVEGEVRSYDDKSNTYNRDFYETIENEDEEELKDLFGSDNEDYVKTPTNSRYPVPVLPVIRNTNNHTRGGYARGGRWQNNRGPGILPNPSGHYSGRSNFGYGPRSFNGYHRDERFVSELKFLKSEETLARKCIAFQEPCELACYSRVEGGDVYFDDRSLRLFKRLISQDIGFDLNEGFDTFIDKRDLGSQGFGDLLACIRNKNIPLQNMHFVTYRNNLNKIMATHYQRHEPWEMGVHRRNGVVYLDVHKLPERPKSELERRRCYWGYCFESLATEDPRRDDGEGIHHVDANLEYCSVIKTKLGAHRILMGAEMDCCDSTDDGRRFYVELKTNRELDSHGSEEYFEKDKLLRIWIQSFLAGVPYIVIGFRDNNGRLVRTERLRTKDITQRVKMKNYWQGGVCLAFADEVLCWLYGTVKDNEDYILQYTPNSTRLELLRADSCPDSITDHVDQL